MHAVAAFLVLASSGHTVEQQQQQRSSFYELAAGGNHGSGCKHFQLLRAPAAVVKGEIRVRGSRWELELTRTGLDVQQATDRTTSAATHSS